jgi:hypothetical protein
MKVYIPNHCDYGPHTIFGIFSSWEKAYDCAMQVNLLHFSDVYIEVWEIDSDEYEISMLIVKRGKWTDDGKFIRWVNPGYSADVDPTENTNKRGGEDE